MHITARQSDQATLACLNSEIKGAFPAPFTENQRLVALTKMYRDAYFSQGMVTLTTGVFLVGFALQFKASNAIIGLLSAIPLLVQLFQLPAVGLVEKLRSRRNICFIASLLSRLCLLPMGLTPWMQSPQLSLVVLILGYIGHTGFGAVSGCAWNSWMKDVVPAKKLGAFISKKLALITAITIGLTLLGGMFIDGWMHWMPQAKAFGYSILFGLGALFGLLGIPYLRSIPEPAMAVAKARQLSWWQTLVKPFKDKNFCRVIKFMVGWNFAINLATPFFTVYMLSMLHLPMALVTGVTIANQVANLIFVRLWGKAADRFSNKAVMAICGPIYIACLLGWTFTTFPTVHAYTVPLVLAVQVLLGVSTAGVTLATFNMGMKLAPASKSTEYMAANNILSSLAAGIAPILGGLFADAFAHQQLSLVLQWHTSGATLALKTLDIQYWDFFFALAFVFGWAVLARLGRIEEPGYVGRRVVLRAFQAEAQHLFERINAEVRVQFFSKTHGHIPPALREFATQKRRIRYANMARTVKVSMPFMF